MQSNYSPSWMTEEVEQFADSVRRFVVQTLAPQEEQWREQHHVSRDAWRAMGEMGMILPDIPAEYGGCDGTAAHVAVANLELFRGTVSGAGIMMKSRSAPGCPGSPPARSFARWR